MFIFSNSLLFFITLVIIFIIFMFLMKKIKYLELLIEKKIMITTNNQQCFIDKIPQVQEKEEHIEEINLNEELNKALSI